MSVSHVCIGLTGGYCSGKNTVAKILEANIDCISLDVDTLGHVALQNAKESVINYFGKSIITSDGQIDRKALGSIVFSSPLKLSMLESFVHPEMFLLVDEWLIKNKNCVKIINAAILYKMPQVTQCDFIINVETFFFLKILRGIKRDGLSIRKIINRIVSQKKISSINIENVKVFNVKNIFGKKNLEKNIMRIIKDFSI